MGEYIEGSQSGSGWKGNVGVGGRQHIDKKILVAISIPYPAKR